MSTVERKQEPVANDSGDALEEQIAGLRKLFPGVFVEGKIDFDKLRAALGGAAESGPGRFLFSWSGKDDALTLLLKPSRATLVPAPDESIDFDATGNIYIEGDNLEILKLLKKPYAGMVKLIYIDPPYNRGLDRIYLDDYADPLKSYLGITGQADVEGNLLTSNLETSGRYHSAWLSMLYPRLFVAHQLMSDDGVIFVSIDDKEVHHLRLLMNEVFGEENFLATLIWQRTDSPSRNEEGRYFSDYHEYILVYARDKDEAVIHSMSKPEIAAGYRLTLPDGRMARARQLRKNGKSARKEDRESMWYPLTAPDGTDVWPFMIEKAGDKTWQQSSEEGRWVLSKATWLEREKAGLTKWEKREYGWVPYYLEIAPSEPAVPWTTLWSDLSQTRQAKAEYTTLMGSINFDSPKPVDLMKRIIQIATFNDSIVMDFFSGSGTTGQAVLELNREDGGNRKFILSQFPERTGNEQFSTIAEIGKERIRRAIAKMNQESAGQLDLADRELPEDLGVKVFKLAAPNIQQFEADMNRDPDAYAQKLFSFHDPLISNWKSENVLWELALREGYGLTATFESKALENGNTVHIVADQAKGQQFTVCLDEQIHENLGKLCALTKQTLLICRDRALDDTTAANLALQCRLKTI
jgi:adenine-specific DNA-methyltransferase